MATKKYLDLEGLETLVGSVKSNFGHTIAKETVTVTTPGEDHDIVTQVPSIVLKDFNGDELAHVAISDIATDTGATSIEVVTGYITATPDWADASNKTTTDYVGYYVHINDTYTLVTSSNKDSLSIVPGTTLAYLPGNAVTSASYDSGDRKITLTKGDKFVREAEVLGIVSGSSKAPVQSKAISDFVNSSINAMAAYYITADSEGSPFRTYEQLENASTFYSGGSQRVPTQNDYTIVMYDENMGEPVGYDEFSTTEDYIGYFVVYDGGCHMVTAGNKDDLGITPGETPCYEAMLPTARYSYQGGTYPNGQWDFQYVLNNTPFTAAMIATLTSGITADDVTKLNGIETGAEVNVLEGVQINGSDLTISSKKVNIVTKSGNAYNASTNKIVDEAGLAAYVSSGSTVSSQADSTTTGNVAAVTGMSVNSSGNVTLTTRQAVTTARTIAGVDLVDDITASELRTALNVADGAQVNTLESVKVDGNAQTITSKAVDLITEGASAYNSSTNKLLTESYLVAITDGEIEDLFL